MTTPKPKPDHVPLAYLWAYHSDKSPLSHDDLQHLYLCDDCLSVLGLCHVSTTIQQVEARLRERGT